MIILDAAIIRHRVVHETGEVVVLYALMSIRFEQTGRPKSVFYSHTRQMSKWSFF